MVVFVLSGVSLVVEGGIGIFDIDCRAAQPLYALAHQIEATIPALEGGD